jgi:hypothetical protein
MRAIRRRMSAARARAEKPSPCVAVALRRRSTTESRPPSRLERSSSRRGSDRAATWGTSSASLASTRRRVAKPCQMRAFRRSPGSPCDPAAARTSRNGPGTRKEKSPVPASVSRCVTRTLTRVPSSRTSAKTRSLFSTRPAGRRNGSVGVAPASGTLASSGSVGEGRSASRAAAPPVAASPATAAQIRATAAFNAPG